MNTRNRWITAAGVVLFCYFFIFPIFWGEPEVAADVPEQARLGEDLTFKVTLSAWHGNFDLTNVRFYVDFHGSTAKGEKGLFNPAIVLERQPRPLGGFWSTRRITWPHTAHYTVTVPLSQFAAEGLLGAGELAGKVDVTDRCQRIRPHRRIRGGDQSITATKSIPFRITISR